MLSFFNGVSAVAGAARDGTDAEGDGDALNVTAVLTANCRYGLAGWDIYPSWIAGQSVGLGWYTDYSAHPAPNVLPGAEFVQTIRVLQGKDANGNYLNTYITTPPLTEQGLGAQVLANRGALWIVGNEPDRGPINPADPNRVQDDTMPQMYARIYHDVYQFIKSRDSTAQVAVAGLVEVTPGRLQYLDIVWSTYQSLYGTTMPVDVWNIHAYILPEADFYGVEPVDIASVALGTQISLAKRMGVIDPFFPENGRPYCDDPLYICTRDHADVTEFISQVVAMRTWMKAHGQQSKPLILSEYGILYTNNYVPSYPGQCWVFDEWSNCFTPARAAQFLVDTFNYMNTIQDANIGNPLDNNRLVQQWLWFSMYYNHSSGLAFVSNIVTPTAPMTFTVVGNAFKNLVTNPLTFPQTINLFPAHSSFNGLIIFGNRMTLTVKVAIMNNGSIAPGAPVTVTVYADAARTQPLGSGVVRNLQGCARRETFAYVSWSVPVTATGAVSYWGTVNPGNPIGETTMSDNNFAGNFFIANPSQLFLPLIRR